MVAYSAEDTIVHLDNSFCKLKCPERDVT